MTLVQLPEAALEEGGAAGTTPTTCSASSTSTVSSIEAALFVREGFESWPLVQAEVWAFGVEMSNALAVFAEKGAVNVNGGGAIGACKLKSVEDIDPSAEEPMGNGRGMGIDSVDRDFDVVLQFNQVAFNLNRVEYVMQGRRVGIVLRWQIIHVVLEEFMDCK